MTKKLRKSAQHRHSFTLVELIVAMGIFSIMMLALMSFFNSAQKLWTASAKRNSVYADARVAMDIMAGMLQSSFYQGETITPFYIKRMTDSSYKSDQICFLSDSSIPLDASYYSKLYMVAFYIDQKYDTSTSNNLYVRCMGDASTSSLWDYIASDNSADLNSFQSLSSGSGSAAKTVIIPYVLALEFNVFQTDTTYGIAPLSPAFNSGTPVEKMPYAIEVKLTTLDRESYKKWIAMGGGGSTPGDPNTETTDSPADKFRKENEKTFSRMVFLGNRF